MRTISKTVYFFDELPKKAQRNAVDNLRNINIDHGIWSEFILEHWKDVLEKTGFANAEIFYRGFWCQGDGACFESDIDLETVLDHLASCVPWKEAKYYFAAIRAWDNGLVSVSNIKTHGMYFHEKSARFSLHDCHLQDCKVADKIVDIIKNEIEELRYSLSVKIYKSLEKTYWEFTTDEAVIEAIQANEYEFIETGELY